MIHKKLYALATRIVLSLIILPTSGLFAFISVQGLQNTDIKQYTTIHQNELIGVCFGLGNSRCIGEYIKIRADEAGINPEIAYQIAYRESGGFAMDVVYGPRTGDNHLVCQRTGDPIRSRGVWQINDCAWPEIPDSVAFDPIASTDWAIEQLRNNPEIWTTYKHVVLAK